MRNLQLMTEASRNISFIFFIPKFGFHFFFVLVFIFFLVFVFAFFFLFLMCPLVDMLFILHSLDEPNKNWGKKTKNNEQIMNKKMTTTFLKKFWRLTPELVNVLGRNQQKLRQMKKNNMKKHEHENYKT